MTGASFRKIYGTMTATKTVNYDKHGVRFRSAIPIPIPNRNPNVTVSLTLSLMHVQRSI